jgi:hypothetical protein
MTAANKTLSKFIVLVSLGRPFYDDCLHITYTYYYLLPRLLCYLSTTLPLLLQLTTTRALVLVLLLYTATATTATLFFD